MRFFSRSLVIFDDRLWARSIYNSSYYETALENDFIRVTFKGGKPPMGTLSAEMCQSTMEKDMKYFEVVDSEWEIPFIRSFCLSFHNHQIHDDPFLNDIPHVIKTIRLFKTNRKMTCVRSLWSSIRRKYEISED